MQMKTELSGWPSALPRAIRDRVDRCVRCTERRRRRPFTTNGAWSFVSEPNLHPPKLHAAAPTVSSKLAPGLS